MNRQVLTFLAPGRVVIDVGPVPRPAADQLLVRTRYSAISPGTEMLVFRDQWPSGVAVDATLEALAGPFTYPLTYGYSVVGRVIEQGRAVAGEWLGRRVFAFQPHQDHFCAGPDRLHPIPDDMDDESALFLPTMETAVNLLLDGAPLIGETVIVVGQGIVGLLTTALLSRFPLAALTTLEHHPLRREASLGFGAGECLDPKDPEHLARLGAIPGRGGRRIWCLNSRVIRPDWMAPLRWRATAVGW